MYQYKNQKDFVDTVIKMKKIIMDKIVAVTVIIKFRA